MNHPGNHHHQLMKTGVESVGLGFVWLWPINVNVPNIPHVFVIPIDVYDLLNYVIWPDNRMVAVHNLGHQVKADNSYHQM
jgi:hypothetical protein